MRVWLFLVMVITGCAGKNTNPKEMVRHPFAAPIDSLFMLWSGEGSFNGNVLIARGDTLVYKGSFGKAEEASGRLLNDSSVFELASVSKQFTAMGIILLREEGTLSLDDSLQQFFPELPYPGIQVRHLLQHTSGLPDYMEIVMKRTDSGSIARNTELISALAQEKPASLFTPGSKWEYSNTGYALLASIIEKVSGKSFQDFLRERIFKPLEMNHTEIYRRRFEKREIPNYAFGYIQKTEGNWMLPDSVAETADMVIELDGIVGDGTVNSTTGDLWKWSRALDRHQLVPAKVQEEIFTAARTADGKEQSYGYGWGLGKDSIFGAFVSHSGGWPGYGTYIEKHLEKGYTIILLSNHDRPEVKLKKVRNILYGIKEQEKQSIQVDEKDLKEYPGTYQIDREFSITISTKGQQVFAQATGQSQFEIFAEKKDLFFLKDVDAKIRFERDAAGKVTGLVLLQNGQEAPGKKIN